MLRRGMLSFCAPGPYIVGSSMLDTVSIESRMASASSLLGVQRQRRRFPESTAALDSSPDDSSM